MTEARFSGPVDFSQVKCLGAVALDKSVFKRSSNFEAIDSQAAFSLADATFHQVPSFIGATFKGKLRLDNVHTPRYRLLGWTTDKDAPARFRELKRLAADAQDYDRELEFFTQEIRTSRFHSTRRWFRFWFWGLLYGTFADFGRSFLRPVLFWSALCLVSATFYLGESNGMKPAWAKLNPEGAWATAIAYFVSTRDAVMSPPPCMPEGSDDLKKEFAGTDPVSEAFYLSLKNGLVGFDAGRADTARRTYGCLYGFVHADGPPKVPYSVSLVSTAQTIASAILIFLFLLAVRNLLRLK